MVALRFGLFILLPFSLVILFGSDSHSSSLSLPLPLSLSCSLSWSRSLSRSSHSHLLLLVVSVLVAADLLLLAKEYTGNRDMEKGHQIINVYWLCSTIVPYYHKLHLKP